MCVIPGIGILLWEFMSTNHAFSIWPHALLPIKGYKLLFRVDLRLKIGRSMMSLSVPTWQCKSLSQALAFADDFMENVEDSEEETGTGEYDQLAAAMAADGEPASDSSESQEGNESAQEDEAEDRQSDGRDHKQKC